MACGWRGTVDRTSPFGHSPVRSLSFAALKQVLQGVAAFAPLDPGAIACEQVLLTAISGLRIRRP